MSQSTDYTQVTALLEIAYALRALGNNNAATNMGGLEALGKVFTEQLGAVADSLDRIADALEGGHFLPLTPPKQILAYSDVLMYVAPKKVVPLNELYAHFGCDKEATDKTLMALATVKAIKLYEKDSIKFVEYTGELMGSPQAESAP